MTKVMTNEFGPATLEKLYPHRDTREVVWDVRGATGERLHLSQHYVDTLPRIADKSNG